MSARAPYIRALSLLGLSEQLAEHGHDLAPLLGECGLPIAALTKIDMLVDFRRVQAFYELAAQRFAIADIGLRAAAKMMPHLPNAGPVMALSRFAPNVREWLKDVMAYWALHTNAYRPELTEHAGPGMSLTRLHPAEPLVWPRQFTEHTMFNIVAMTRLAADRPDESASVVRFQHGAPADVSPHAEAFGCRVEFGCEYNEIEFPTEVLDYPMGRLLTPLRSTVRRYVQHRIDRLEHYDVSFATNVALTITSMIGSGKTDIASIAEAMVIHPKQLQRQLAQEGTTFSALLDDVRSSMAQDMMTNSSAPVGQVARLLGYAANAPFTAAFRKWTDSSPLQWRTRHRRDDS